MRGPEFDCVLPDALARAENLPSPPFAALELLRLAQDEHAGLDDYSRALSSDPLLAQRILALANSVPFRLGHEVTSLQRATMVLGMKTVQLMAIAFSLVSPLRKKGASPSFDHEGFWRRSVVIAVAGRELGRIVGFTLAEEAFLCGLSSHIGQLVLAECMTAEYEEVLKLSPDWPSREIEEEVLGFDNFGIGAAVLKTWGLPPPIYMAIAHFTAPEELPAGASSSTRKLCQIVHMAVLVGRVLCDEYKDAPLRDLRARAEGAGLTRGQVDTLILSLEPRIRETAELFAIDLGPIRSHHEILEEARRQAASDDARHGVGEFGDREYLEAVLAREVESRLRGDIPEELGVILVEVADFDRVKREHGSSAAAEVLRVLGRAVRGFSRDSDAAARFDDRRFAVLVPRCTPFGLSAFAARIEAGMRERFARVGRKTIHFRVCVGGAHVDTVTGPAAGVDLLDAARSALAMAVDRGPGSSEIRRV